MTAVHLLNVSIHISQGTLLLCKEFLGMLDNGRNQEQGQRNDNQLMDSIMTRNPIICTIEVIICARDWLRVCCTVSISLEKRDSTSP